MGRDLRIIRIFALLFCRRDGVNRGNKGIISVLGVVYAERTIILEEEIIIKRAGLIGSQNQRGTCRGIGKSRWNR